MHCYEWCKDTGIASEQDWGINLKSQPVTESGVNEDGSSWYRESGEDLGDNGYRCRWNVMGGRNADGSVEWKETVQFHISVVFWHSIFVISGTQI